MSDTVKIKLSQKQRQFLQSKTKGTIFRGGIGSGKSRILVYKAILNAMQGRRELIVSFSFPMLRDVILYTIIEAMPIFGLEPVKDYVINKSEMTVTIWGTQILLRSGDAPDSIRGLNCHDFFIDEARNFKTDEIFLICLGRIRECTDAQWFISTTPRGKDWVWALGNDPDVTLLVQGTRDNPFLPKSYIEELEKRYTSKFAAQELEGSIVELGAGVIDPEWFKYIDRYDNPVGVRAWDMAVSIKTSADYTAGVLCSYADNKFIIRDIIHGRFEYPDLKKKIITAAKMDGKDVWIGLEEAGQQLGFIDDLRKATPELLPYVIKAVKPWGDKLNRMLPWLTRAESGMVYVVRGAWNKAFEDECRDFTADMSHLHDDMLDGVSLAYHLSARVGEVTSGKVRF